MDWQNWLVEQDRLIKNAQGVFAKKNIRKINWSQVTEGVRYDILDIARRLQMPFLIIKNLYRDIRVLPKSIDEVLPQYVMIYASSLAKIGAFQEAWSLFEVIKSRKEIQPLIHLHMGMALVSQWNYAQASIYFEKYLASPALTDYQKLIGQINFVSCLVVNGELERAKKILQVFDDLEKTYPLLFLNSRELLLQIYSNEQSFEKAILLCQQVKDNINFVSSGLYYHFIRKWELINDSRLHGRLSPDWIKFQNSAKENNEFEIVRDLDFFRVLIDRDEKLLMKLYLGTPFEIYKKRIINVFRLTATDKFEYLIEFEGRKRKKVTIIDANEELLYDGQKIKILPKKAGQLIRCLTKDIYRPIYLGDLFGSIYQGEYFNPFSSPKRLEKLIQRVQIYFENNQINFKVVSKAKTYWLNLNADIKILISEKNIRSDFTVLKNWIQQNGLKKFTRNQLQKELKSSKAQVNRMIAKLIDDGKLKRRGRGRSTFYLVSF